MSEHEELVERVAKALYDTIPRSPRLPEWDEAGGDTRDYWSAYARSALDALADDLRHDPPEGCEWVALPTEDVDRWCEGLGALVDVPSVRSGSIGVLGQVVDACHGAVARRPKPEPRTERVPAVEALGRKVVSDEGSSRPTFTGYSIAGRLTGGLAIRSATGDCWQRIAPDGTVEVLAEDDDQ